MSLPKKNSRLIEVDGRTYRWMAKAIQVDPGESARSRLTVQDEVSGEIHQRTLRGWDGGPVSVTPATAKEFILERFPSHR